jgi:hypothetical protein
VPEERAMRQQSGGCVTAAAIVLIVAGLGVLL